MFDDLTKQLLAQREESDRLRAALKEANRKNMQMSLSAASQLEAAVEAERRASEEDRAQLMLQVTELVTKSSQKREERLNTALTSTQASIVEATEQFEVADKTYGDGIDRWNDQDSALREKIAKSKEDVKGHFKKDWSAISDRNTRIQESTKAVHGETVKIVDVQVKDMATQMAALDEFVVRARRQNNEHAEQHLITLQGLSTQLKDSLEKVQTRVSSSAMDNFTIGIKAHLDEISSTFADVQDKAREPLHQLQENLASTDMVNYIPTGQTPRRKEWSYPTELPRTIPPPSSSTTPSGKPLGGSSFSRTPGKSPRKMISPRKSPKKQIVRVDTPPSQPEPAPAQEEMAQPLQLRELDTNIQSAPLASSLEVEKVSIVPMPIKPIHSKSFHVPRLTRASVRRGELGRSTSS